MIHGNISAEGNIPINLRKYIHLGLRCHRRQITTHIVKLPLERRYPSRVDVSQVGQREALSPTRAYAIFEEAEGHAPPHRLIERHVNIDVTP